MKVSQKLEWEVLEKGDGYILYGAKVRCPDTEPHVPDGWELYNCGGAYPMAFVYDPHKYRVEWLSAKEAIEYWDSEYPGEVGRADASTHSCWKLRKNQLCVLVHL